MFAEESYIRGDSSIEQIRGSRKKYIVINERY